MSDPNDTTEVFGGEIWKQPNFPCFTSYIISGLPGKRFMARTSDPRVQGNVLFADVDGDVAWTPEELYKYLRSLKYECMGQLRDILMADLDKLLTTDAKETK